MPASRGERRATGWGGLCFAFLAGVAVHSLLISSPLRLTQAVLKAAEPPRDLRDLGSLKQSTVESAAGVRRPEDSLPDALKSASEGAAKSSEPVGKLGGGVRPSRQHVEAQKGHAVGPTEEGKAEPGLGAASVPPHDLHDECDAMFGDGLFEAFAASEAELCRPNGSEDAASLRCWSLQHPYQRQRGRWSTFCEGRNLIVDFSRVHEPRSATKTRKYHTFAQGSLQGACRRTAEWTTFSPSRWMNHMRPQMESFQEVSRAGEAAYAEVEETTTILMARDEDCENTFHSAADHINLYIVSRFLGLSPASTRALLFDTHPDYPYVDLIHDAFAAAKPLARAADFGGAKVLFRRLVWHLESPGSIVNPSMMDPLRCTDSPIWNGFRAQVLQAFNLWNVPPPQKPTVAFILRNRVPQKNLGRILGNSDDLLRVLESGNALDFKAVDLASMPFKEQLAVVRHANILVGVHGAGLMHVIFTAEEAVLLEIHPPYRLDR
eukprot:scaffold180_cov311-Pinguiococcus_pyrenoidosus.AAC.49